MGGKTLLSAYDLYDMAVMGQIVEEEEETEEEEGEEGDAGRAPEAEVRRRKVKSMKRDILFTERCLDLLKPGGRMAIVLPQGNLNNQGPGLSETG